MRLEMSAELLISRWLLFAEIATYEQRPELKALCQIAGANGGQLDGEAVLSALPGLSPRSQKNIVRFCAELGLCAETGALTEQGVEVGNTGLAPVPEQGVYELWVGEHDAIGLLPMHVERAPEEGGQAAPEDLIPPPRLTLGTPVRSAVEPELMFAIRDFPAVGQVLTLKRDTTSQCTLTLRSRSESKAAELRLEGELDEQRQAAIDLEHPPEVDVWEILDQLAVGPLAEHGIWSTAHRELAVRPDGLNEQELDRFTRRITIEDVNLSGLGRWDRLVAHDVPLGPVDEPAAQDWVMALLDRRLDRISDAVTRSNVIRVFDDLGDNHALARFTPTLPDHAALLERHRVNPQRFWRLAAPVDLNPFPATELTQLRLGEPADQVETAKAVTDQIRLGYGTLRRMQDVVDDLLDSTQPSSVLLCDRFVRGRRNLNSLRTLRQSLEPGVRLEIWTGEDVAPEDVKEIESITDCPPRLYSEIFGRQQPHDRYLLVRSGKDSFGWHMSNSLLDGRASETIGDEMVRWRDLIAVRCAPDALPQPMQDWLKLT